MQLKTVNKLVSLHTLKLQVEDRGEASTFALLANERRDGKHTTAALLLQ
jgi:hypothetical protein